MNNEPRRQIEADYALIHATVIDATGSPPNANLTVAIKNDRIVAIGKDGTFDIAKTGMLIDAADKYIIPGLTDIHVHTDERISPSMYIVNGVTTVREMSGSPFHLKLREQIKNKKVLGPHIHVGSPMMDGSPSLWQDTPASFYSICDEIEAKKIVHHVNQEGYDFVKIYSRLRPNVYLAIVEEAKKQSISFAGHCPDEISIFQASAIGQRSFEHLFGIAVAVSSKEEELRSRAKQIVLTSKGFSMYPSWFEQMHEIDWEAAQTYSEAKAEVLYKQFVGDNSAQVPTLAMFRIFHMPNNIHVDKNQLKYISSSMVEEWKLYSHHIYMDGVSQEKLEQRWKLYDRTLKMVGELHRAGVKVLAGTDTGTPWLVNGFSLHDELELLVESGLSPMAALQAATLEPAKFLGKESSMGTVQEGKIADLVILDANPLEDIRNTKKIHAVVANGRLISANERQKLLKDLENKGECNG